MKISCCL